MTQEEKFKEAKRLYQTANADQKYVLESLFPELKESEDERIRKGIESIIKHYRDKGEVVCPYPFVTLEEALAWLEKQDEQKDILEDAIFDSNEDGLIAETIGVKQGEQKPAWSEEDDKNLEKTIWHVEKGGKLVFAKTDKLVSWLKSLKDRVQPQPKQEWSEEDESHIRYLIECLEYCKKGVALTMTTSTSQEYINWLKSLRPQNTWKPSDEQIEILDMVLTNESMDDNLARILRELREQLKKLREE